MAPQTPQRSARPGEAVARLVRRAVLACALLVAGTPHDVTLKIYPGARHGFDRLQPGPRVYLGHTLERHPKAAIDAEEQVQRFLARYLVR